MQSKVTWLYPPPPRRLKADVMEQTAAAYSDQAASYLDQNVSIKESRSPIPLEEPQV